MLTIHQLNIMETEDIMLRQEQLQGRLQFHAYRERTTMQEYRAEQLVKDELRAIKNILNKRQNIA